MTALIIRITGIVRRCGFAAGTVAATGPRTAGASTGCTADFMIIVYSLDGAAGAPRPATPELTAGRPNVGGDSTGGSGDKPAGGSVGSGADATGGGIGGGAGGAAPNAGGESDGGMNEESAPGAGDCALPAIAVTGAASGGNGGRALTPADIGTADRADDPRSGSGSSGSEAIGTGDTAGTTGTGGPAVWKGGVPLPRCAPAVTIEVNSPGAAFGVADGTAATGGAGAGGGGAGGGVAGGPVCTSGVGRAMTGGTREGGGDGASPVGRNICGNSPATGGAAAGITTGAGATGTTGAGATGTATPAGAGGSGNGNGSGGAPAAGVSGSGDGTEGRAGGAGDAGATDAPGGTTAKNIAVPSDDTEPAPGTDTGICEGVGTVRARSHGMKLSRPSSARVITAQPRSVMVDSITTAASAPVNCASRALICVCASCDVSSSTCASTGSPTMRSTPMNVRTPSCCAMTMDSR